MALVGFPFTPTNDMTYFFDRGMSCTKQCKCKHISCFCYLCLGLNGCGAQNFFGNFRMSEFAFGWRAKQRVLASYYNRS